MSASPLAQVSARRDDELLVLGGQLFRMRHELAPLERGDRTGRARKVRALIRAAEDSLEKAQLLLRKARGVPPAFRG